MNDPEFDPKTQLESDGGSNPPPRRTAIGLEDSFGNDNPTVRLAKQEAAAHGYRCVGTEHLLLGSALQPESIVAGALESLGVSLDDLRAQVEDTIGKGIGVLDVTEVHLTKLARHALYVASVQFQIRRFDQIETEHILLSILGSKCDDGVAVRILERLNIDAAKLESLLR